ncbi:MAG: HNH endonuclease family protein [Eubacteriales bacterium]
MDEKLIVHNYVIGRRSVRSIAYEMNTDCHKIKHILNKYGILITQKDRTGMQTGHGLYYDEAESQNESNKNMKSHKHGRFAKSASHSLRNRFADIDLPAQFEDTEKIGVLNGLLLKDKAGAYFGAEKYKQFIEKFYDDPKFIQVYTDWLAENKAAFAEPSLSYIIPLSKGGTRDIDNLQIIPSCLNRAKSDFLPEEWEYIKNKYISL